MKTPKVSIIMGSTSDLPVMEKAAKLFDEFEIPFEMLALSAHRTPHEVEDFAVNAQQRGIQVIIAAAGMAAALPGVIASMTALPVIGVVGRANYGHGRCRIGAKNGHLQGKPETENREGKQGIGQSRIQIQMLIIFQITSKKLQL